MLRIDDLRNKSVLVTGASTGIGAALSRAFALQGARVGVHFNSNAAGADAVVQDIRSCGRHGGWMRRASGRSLAAGPSSRPMPPG